MFTFFFNLIVSLMIGDWRPFDIDQIGDMISRPINGLGLLLTSIFNDTATPLDNLSPYFGSFDLIYLAGFVVAIVLTIGVVVAVINIIKRIFTIFFQGVR